MSNSSFTPSRPVGQSGLVPEATVVQGSPAHHVSLIHDKPIQQLFHDRREVYVNEHTVQDDERSTTKQLLKRNASSSVIPNKHPASTSRHRDAPDARPTTTATDVPSTGASRPLLVSPERGTSYVDVIENRLPSAQFTDHKTSRLNKTPTNPTLYTTRRGMY